MKSSTKGFTLIELLVVISIIGILSAVVLTQLNSARAKGIDAAKKANLANIPSKAAQFYDNADPQNWLGVCSELTPMTDAAGGVCNQSFAGYRILVPLQQQNQFGSGSGVDYLCMDARNIIKLLDTNPGGTSITCP